MPSKVRDPLDLLGVMVYAFRSGGQQVIVICFIQRFLELDLHVLLMLQFQSVCSALGLEVCAPCEGSHATLYKRTHLLEPDWRRLRFMERFSQLLFPWRELSGRHLSPWSRRARMAIHHPRKIVRALRAAD